MSYVLSREGQSVLLSRNTACPGFYRDKLYIVLSAFNYQLKSHTMNIFNGDPGIFLQVFSEAGNEHIQASSQKIIITAPNLLEQFFAGNELVLLRDQVAKHFRFSHRQLYAHLVYREEEVGKIELVFSNHKHLG